MYNLILQTQCHKLPDLGDDTTSHKHENSGALGLPP